MKMISALRQWYHDWSTQGERAAEKVFAGRVALSDDEFFELHFVDGSVLKEVAIGVRRVFVEHVPLDMRRLAPDDNFARELQFVWSYDSLADVELLLDVEKRFQVSFSEAEGSEIVTMGALIRLVDQKVKARTS